MKKTFIKRSVALACALTALATTTACGGKKEDGEQMLEMFLWDAGYGTDWLYTMSEDFQSLDWVKEKYPNLKIKIETNSDSSKADTLLDAGEAGGNTVDLFFDGNLEKYMGVSYDGKQYFEDLTEPVYNQLVPGENVTFKDKILDCALDTFQYYDKGQDSNSEVPFKSYATPWMGGFSSLIYNADHLEHLGLEVPLTTQQLVETCETVQNSKELAYNLREDAKGGYAILTDAGGNYWDDFYQVWWAQYEGMEGFYNFFNGFDGEAISYKVHEQKGKLYALQVLEDLLKWDNGYVYQNRTAYDYMAAQTQFYSGDAVFYAMGDWIADEMKEIVADLKEFDGVEYNIRMMRLPIVSQIIELTPSITSDEMLRAVVKAIDDGYATQAAAKAASYYAYPETLGISAEEAAKCADITEADYAKIADARSIQQGGGGGHGCVPVYAQGKEIAYDFLRYLATDQALEIYAEKTSGSLLPFEYDMSEETYNKIPQVTKDSADFVSDTRVKQIQFLPGVSKFPLVKWGGMAAVKSTGGAGLINYFMGKGAVASAQQIWSDDIEYYKTAFAECMSNAGLS